MDLLECPSGICSNLNVSVNGKFAGIISLTIKPQFLPWRLLLPNILWLFSDITVAPFSSWVRSPNPRSPCSSLSGGGGTDWRGLAVRNKMLDVTSAWGPGYGGGGGSGAPISDGLVYVALLIGVDGVGVVATDFKTQSAKSLIIRPIYLRDLRSDSSNWPASINLVKRCNLFTIEIELSIELMVLNSTCSKEQQKVLRFILLFVK